MKRHKHNLSNYKLLTADMGQLIPVQVQEVLPGDSFKMNTSALVRLSPMLAPVMHPTTIRFHHWFVPNRLLWQDWEDFITGADDTLEIPEVYGDSNMSPEKKALFDYLGAPIYTTGSAIGYTPRISALPVRAYNMIYNHFYRDQDLVPERDWHDTSIARVAWGKDNFTTARPWSQKNFDLKLPIGDRAGFVETATGLPADAVQTSTGGLVGYYEGTTNGIGLNNQLKVDLSGATGVSATDFREFFAMQRYAEARARYGSRYTEYLRYLGVKPSDARLQLPEYLGGGKSTIQFSEVLQTAEGTNPVGTMRGHGISALKTRGVKRFFEEHGVVITLMSVVPKSIYSTGVPRFMLKRNKEDFFQKELQDVGAQPVWESEIHSNGDSHANQHEVFGYNDRYYEYKETPSLIHGEFRDLLSHWHLARQFDKSPNLGLEFVECNPTKRIFAEQTKHSLWIMVNNRVAARRMVKKNTAVGKLK